MEKEEALKEVVARLNDTQQSLQRSTQKSAGEIETLTKQLSEAQSLLQTTLTNKGSVKELEITHLRSDNQRLASTVQKLESTVNGFKVEFKSLSSTNKRQLNEIAALHDENKQLTQTITLLSDALEAKKEAPTAAQSTPNRGMRLFAS